jgi:hypothetical protein
MGFGSCAGVGSGVDVDVSVAVVESCSVDEGATDGPVGEAGAEVQFARVRQIPVKSARVDISPFRFVMLVLQ